MVVLSVLIRGELFHIVLQWLLLGGGQSSVG